jgi:hypothetical protein
MTPTTNPRVAGHCTRARGLACGGSCGFAEQSCCAPAARNDLEPRTDVNYRHDIQESYGRTDGPGKTELETSRPAGASRDHDTASCTPWCRGSWADHRTGRRLQEGCASHLPTPSLLPRSVDNRLGVARCRQATAPDVEAAPSGPSSGSFPCRSRRLPGGCVRNPPIDLLRRC